VASKHGGKSERQQVFICYARPQDNEHADNLYNQLEDPFIKPWMDRRDIDPGKKWDPAIRAAIKSSRYFLVILTRHSVNKRGYLQKEIKQALDLQKEKLEGDRYIIPVRIKDCPIPEQFSDLQCADLFELDGLSKLKRSLVPEADDALIFGATSFGRLPELSIGGVRTPCFFPSISGAAKNSLSPLEHLKILIALDYPAFLVSAFDIINAEPANRKAMLRLLHRAASRGQIILLDSGLYEKKWLRVKNWPRKSFHYAVRHTPCHFAFCYDNPSPTGTASKIASAIVSATIHDKNAGQIRSIVPVVHSTKSKLFPSICTQIIKRLDVRMLAIPERELGAGIVAAAQTIALVREALNRTGRYYSLHILGAGNPLSVLVYSACGADSFDGLDWCQTVVDHTTARLYHTMQLDFFAHQTQFGTVNEMSYFARASAHNLLFYKNWMMNIQKQILVGSLNELLDRFVPSETISNLRRALPSNAHFNKRV